jgi:hypothetical protein
MKKWLFLLILALLWHSPLSADTSKSTQSTPRITIPNPSYQFDPAIEGDVVTHEFTLVNSGNALLEILKVQTG